MPVLVVSFPASHPLVEPSLNFNVSLGLQLEISLLVILAEIPIDRALNVHRMSIVPFDQIAVVAVHRSNEVGQRFGQALVKACPKRGGSLGKLEYEFGQVWPGGVLLRDPHRLHEIDILTIVSR